MLRPLQYMRTVFFLCVKSSMFIPLIIATVSVVPIPPLSPCLKVDVYLPPPPPPTRKRNHTIILLSVEPQIHYHHHQQQQQHECDGTESYHSPWGNGSPQSTLRPGRQMSGCESASACVYVWPYSRGLWDSFYRPRSPLLRSREIDAIQSAFTCAASSDPA